MADPLNIGGVRIDENRFRKMTPQEIIKEESQGADVPPEVLAWAEQMAAFSKIPDNVTYEKVDGDIGLEALEKLGLEDPAFTPKPENENAQGATRTVQPDAVKDPVRVQPDTEPDNNVFAKPVPGQAADEIPPEEQEPTEEDLTLADPTLTTDPEEIRKRKERKGLIQQ